MIKDFADKDAENFWLTGISALPPDIRKRAYRKLQQLHAAKTLDFLRVPPGNELEKLIGDRKGFYSIRINRRWRICFKWDNGNVSSVEIVDYH